MMNIEQPPKDSAQIESENIVPKHEVHSEAVPGATGYDGKIEMNTLKYDDTHDIIDVQIGPYIVKTCRYDENGIKRMVEKKDFEEGKGQLFFNKDYFYEVYDKDEKFLGNVNFSESELKKLKDAPQSPETHKMILQKSMSAAVQAADEKAAGEISETK